MPLFSMTVAEYLRIMESAIDTIPDVIQAEVAQSKDVILSLNKDQLLAGRNADGEVLTPTYTGDPYFKTAKAANAYKKMKMKLESMHRARMRFDNILPYPAKSDDTPNLIVTGMFQEGMFIDVYAGAYEIGSMYHDSDDIERKYDNKVFGLSPESKELYWNDYLQPAVVEHIKNKF